MIKEPSVTPERLRDIARIYLQYDGYDEAAQELRSLADWLDEHMKLYREAVDLLPRMQPNQNDHDPFEVIDRARVLIAKVKGE